MPASARSVVLLAALLLAGCAAVEPGAFTDRNGWVIQREFLQQQGKKIELFWARPAGERRAPVVLFIHGHQEEPRNGGETFVTSGRLGIMARQGYVAASLSQPGYGNSDGPPDFCGPVTQDAALAALEHLRAKAFVDPDKVVLYGYSRGAVVAAMVATRDAKLAAVVLGAGVYDFFSWYPTPFRSVDTTIQREAGTSAAAFRARSALHHADRIRVPVLLLHGERDERAPVRQAQAFAAQLAARGVAVTLRIFPDTMHGIPFGDQFREVYSFLDRVGVAPRSRVKPSSNARAFLAVPKEFGSFDRYVWSFVGGEPRQNSRKAKDIPARTPQSDALSKDLQRRGFRFVGSTICYAYMQAVGMVNDHVVGCYRHKELA